LALAACSSGSDPSPSASASPAITLDRQALTETVTGLRDEMRAPGVAVMLLTPEGNFELADGTTQLGGATPVTLDDHVRIGSNTKTFTTSVILQLVEEGKIDIDAPVADYWPGIPAGDEITIEQLLNMRSGLFNYSETLKLNKSLDEDPERVWRPRELLRMGISRPPYFPPGEGWHYSNTNTVLLGLIAEKIEGKPLPDIIEERLITPLALANTSFPPSDTAAIPNPHPQGYMYGTNVSTMKTMALPPAEQEAAAAGKLLPSDVTDENPSWTWSAGQMISTAGDLAVWVKALGSTGVLSADLQKQRLSSVAPANDSLPAGSAEYGWGIAKMGPLYGHTGELPGFNSFMGYDPDNDVTLIVWSNLGSAANGDSVATTIAQAILAQTYGLTPPASS
jgi:D-alanyl-D-alanine carboxypeptidase